MATICPILGYRDAETAIAWLGEAFGFIEHAVMRHDGGIAHAEMRYGDDIVMLGEREEHKETYGIYVVVDDPDAHHTRAVAAGATITRELTDMDYGSREYSCLDPEGHEWHFGTWRPVKD
ncbi:hypothetical protein Afil01_02850 [Actinorhabdospora filicis]|uniref:Glyoxalase/fosfomycin resistance/dioxygenase domain-containing protein n=1 Tax=Actinorhabdospora filicis TaxID=1785913 RepID=A0A9W6SGA9_9ACTN|nr:VOC family protein [Actinorhabdospora filicis]GLZ75478.1 hypothetical protein Afil01_02850 [Actinorhabdospora filicis]